MQRILRQLPLACLLTVLPVLGDVVILHDGSSYSGHLSSLGSGASEIKFTGADGVGFTFPVADVQSLVFTPQSDSVTLRSGKTYSGHYFGDNRLHFLGSEGITYDFPVKDISSLVLTTSNRNANHDKKTGDAKVVSVGTQISITTNERIDSKHAEDGQLFSATIAEAVPDTAGGTAIAGGTPAKLVVRNIRSGGAVGTPELVLDLFSVNLGGREYRTVTTNVVERGRQTVGANKRTLEYAGTGTGLGALLGGIFGGGQGAGIGALAGAGGGALTQLFTRGKEVKVPAEATLTFRLDHTLVLSPR